jgi:predicted house-cleaning noncanonical NTP pyrophosphatase (MazG superfamily)
MKYEKLVRDKIPQILDKKGILYKKRKANDKEYKLELIKKLKEEVEEFIVQGSVEEFADVLEVVDNIKKLKEYVNVVELQNVKRIERGGFDERIILRGEK